MVHKGILLTRADLANTFVIIISTDLGPVKRVSALRERSHVASSGFAHLMVDFAEKARHHRIFRRVIVLLFPFFGDFSFTLVFSTSKGEFKELDSASLLSSLLF
jgi:hypothetical protein